MECLKVMVTGNDESIIWDLSKETEVESNHMAFVYLSNEINILEWKRKYLNLYKKWLKDEDDSICQISSPINMDMINALITINLKAAEFKLYYWFDVDRDKRPDYIWEKCPLSHSDLVVLSGVFHENNRKISPNFPLIFP
nr:hypothetical protein [uncultured Pedobacter sp.]